MHYFELSDGRKIACEKSEGEGPGVLFLTGFKSDMSGQKALALDAYCREKNIPFVRFDYTGHGQSSGKFEDGTIGAWLQDSLDVFDQLTQGPQIVVGSSMGGWLMLLLALKRPDRVAALVGLASAPDFTERLIWDALNDAQKKQVMEEGSFAIPNCYGDQEPYHITRKLIEEGAHHLLLGGKINIHCPVRLMHGTKDEDVPYSMSQQLVEKLASTDVQLTLIKNAGHRLSDPEHLKLLCSMVELARSNWKVME